MRILLYNQDIVELKRMSDEVIEALSKKRAMLDVCSSYLKDKKKLNHVVYDIAIIDLSDGKEDALFLSRHLRENNRDCMIILLGNDYKESIFAFEIKASLFVLKDDCDLKRELNKVVIQYKEKNPWFYFYKDDKKEKIYLKDIVYVDSAGKDIVVVCKDQRYISLKKENNHIIEMILKYGFIQVHQSDYISLRYLASFKKGEVTFINNESVSVSLKYRKNLHEKLAMFMADFG